MAAFDNSDTAFTLDGLVTERRDRLSIGLATPEEVAKLAASLAGGAQPRDTIDPWYLVSFRVPTGSVLRLLGGSRRTGRVWITSSVTAVDLEAAVLTTHSGSRYALGTRGEGEPPVEFVLHVAAALWMQTPGLARAFGIREAWY